MPELKPWKKNPEPETQEFRNKQAVFVLMQCINFRKEMMKFEEKDKGSFPYNELQKQFDKALENFKKVKNKKDPAVDDVAIKDMWQVP